MNPRLGNVLDMVFLQVRQALRERARELVDQVTVMGDLARDGCRPVLEDEIYGQLKNDVIYRLSRECHDWILSNYSLVTESRDKAMRPESCDICHCVVTDVVAAPLGFGSSRSKLPRVHHFHYATNQVGSGTICLTCSRKSMVDWNKARALTPVHLVYPQSLNARWLEDEWGLVDVGVHKKHEQ